MGILFTCPSSDDASDLLGSPASPEKVPESGALCPLGRPLADGGCEGVGVGCAVQPSFWRHD